MRPYFAIILDSFRAALASRVLYALLAFIVLLLLAIAPFHVVEGLDWKLQLMSHVPNPPRLVSQLVERSESDDHPAVKRIWQRLTQPTRDKLIEINAQNGERPSGNEGGRRNRPRRGDLNQYFGLINELNEIIMSDDFYEADDWEGKVLNQEAKDLIAAGTDSLDTERRRRLNRLLVGKALPAIENAAPTSMTWFYGWQEIFTYSSTRERLGALLSENITWLLDKFVLSIALAVGIVVTANVIPETFDPGSLNLLLSKPISRSGLYLTKFVGGCVLIAICSVLLFVGLWLWMGIAVGVWDAALLWSIPIYILVFAIYFSISAFVGLTFRSPIMSVVMTVLFWAICFSLGSGYYFLNVRMENTRLYRPVAVDDVVIAQDGVGNLVRWDSGSQAWETAAKPASSMGQDQEVGLAIAVWFGKFKDEPFMLAPVVDGQGHVYAGLNFLLDIPLRSHQGFYFAESADQPFRQYGRFPREAVNCFGTSDGLLVVDRVGDFHLLDPKKLDEIEGQADESPEANPEEPVEDKSDDAEDDEDATTPVATSAESLFVKAGPSFPVRASGTYSVAFNMLTEEVAIHEFRESAHRIYVFKKEGDQYTQDRSVQIDIGSEKRIRCYVAFQGNTILVVAGNGNVVSLDATTLKERNAYQPETRFPIETIAASPDGRWFGLVYANQYFWLLDTESDDRMTRPDVTGQGAISSVGFDQDSRLLVADRQDRITVYDSDSLSIVETHVASGGLFETVFRYGIRPMYYAFPKPSEFYKVVAHMSSTRDTSRNEDVDLIGTQVSADPFSPLYSGVGFMLFMLFVSCTIFHFKDY
ncbi:MAG: ABC transporter permease [Planctomycetota bacterium]